MKQSGGDILVTSTLGGGSVFIIRLPQAHGEPARHETPGPTSTGRGSETVLLVEDDEAVRTLTRRVLLAQGYRVLAAPSAEAALELSRGFAEPIHLLLTDVVMPGMNGSRLADVLERERPGMRCLFMSGYAAGRLSERAISVPEHAYLQKPFTATQLFQRVRKVLDADVLTPQD